MLNHTDTRPTIAQRIEQHGITMEAKRIDSRPDSNTDWGKDATHFEIALRRGAFHTMKTFYSMGSGHISRFVLAAATLAREPEIVKGDIARAMQGKHNDELRKQLIARYGAKFPGPSCASVLDSLALDAAGVENAGGFEEWAREYGYDTDSRKAEGTYRACTKIRDDLRRFMGTREAFEDLIYNTEAE